VTARARRFEFAVELAANGDVTGDRGGTPLPAAEREQWTPEHLLLAGLARCSLKSLAFHAERAGLSGTSAARASGTVTRRESDGRFAFVEITVDTDVTLAPAPADDDLDSLLHKAERDCFVGASLSLTPTYHWTVNGRQR
jgi:organic hydroperoxide reductase OsmC/OhrA